MGAPVQVGEVIAAKYEITKILGEGGMGVVVAARHLELDKQVALKFMHEEVAKTKTSSERFLREARAAARLQSEHVARVLDVGRMPNGVPYIVMEFLNGRDLGDVLAQRGPLDVADACEYVLQTCEAMAEAHAAGIVHRDLKPQNLFLTTRQDGRPLIKILDFGISKAQHAQFQTSTNAVMGSPAYMSPEQMRASKYVDHRADIWSIGVVLYQLLSNTLPFTGENFAEALVKVLEDPPPPLHQLRPGLPPALVAVVHRCLEKEREQRFETVAELAHALMPFAPDRARAAMSLLERVVTAGTPALPRAADPELDAVVPSVAHTETAHAPAMVQTTLSKAASQSVQYEAPPRRSRRSMLAVIAGSLALAVAITAWVVSSGNNAAKESDAATPTASPAAAPALPIDAAITSMKTDDAPLANASIADARPVDASTVVDARVGHRDAGSQGKHSAHTISVDAKVYKPMEDPEAEHTLKPVGDD